MNVDPSSSRISQQPIHSASAPSEEVQLDERERLASNVVGVIASIVVGIFATIGTFFLAVMLGGGLGLGAVFGISLVGGASCAVGAFFLFRYAMQQLIKARNSNAADKHDVKPPPGSSKGSASPSYVESFEIKCKEFTAKISASHEELKKQNLEGFESTRNKFKEVDPANEVPEELNEILKKEFEQIVECIAIVGEELSKYFQNKFQQIGVVLSPKNVTYDQCKKMHDALIQLAEQTIQARDRNASKMCENVRSGGEQLKEKHNHELFSKQVDIMVQHLTGCLDSVFAHYKRCLNELIEFSKNCLSELSQSQK